MFELYLKSWYQEEPNNIQEEVIYTADYIEDVWNHLKENGDNYIECYPLVEFGIRISEKI